MCNDLVRRLRRMQLVIPQEMGQANIRLRCAIRAIYVAQVVLPRDIRRRRQVLVRVVVDIGDQPIYIEDGK